MNGITVIKKKNKPQKIEFPKYKIIIWNDDTSVFELVVKLLEVVFSYHETDACKITTDIHETGKIIAWSGTYEVGELKLEQCNKFKNEFNEYLKNLKITLEEDK